MMGSYKKPTANLKLNGKETKKMKAFSLKLGTLQECPLLPLPPNIVLKVLARAIKNERKKRKQDRKWGGRAIEIAQEELKLATFTTNMTV